MRRSTGWLKHHRPFGILCPDLRDFLGIVARLRVRADSPHGIPAVLVLVTGLITMALGASAPGLAQLTWSGLLTVFAVRLVNPMDGPLGEEPGFRGYALALLQASRPPLVSAAILGVLIALWHLPLVLFGGLSLIGLPTTFAITFLYVWLFNRTGGSVLLTLLFHNSQGTFTMGSFGFTGAGADRAELIYFGVVVLAVLATVALDRRAWRKAPRPATAVGRFSFRRRPR
ncbi:CPBP family intramembrane metalloprotease [Pseudarthrobacter sp. MDT3-28]|uniref:CPBP family intramembrane glutamic endopeptidase n=1 Tax=Pseudarthrobacter raffinosi TaxID=2953651 RepID=UPI00208F742B|nr:CPBP family intramembrane glutamic endopeptidase [Pseudarthrobacter sp. MDT3-28]MCO4238903.1 CPBP family intramembrane metalloprotease [Pseudarthrobacter sp. MDT3-28]